MQRESTDPAKLIVVKVILFPGQDRLQGEHLMQYTTSTNPIIYPLLPKIFDAGNVETYFAICRQDIDWVQSIPYTGDTRVALLFLLAGFLSLGYFPELSRFSFQVIKHIAHALEVDAPL